MVQKNKKQSDALWKYIEHRAEHSLSFSDISRYDLMPVSWIIKRIEWD